MSKLSLFKKKGSESMVTEAKSLRQQMAEQESGFRVVRKAPGSPKVGEVYEGEYWTVEWPNAWDFCVLECRSCYTSLTCEEDTELEALRRLRVATIKAHPGMEPLFGHLGLSHYATQDEALYALERALYGFDLSGREPERKPDPQPALKESKAALPDPSVKITIDPKYATAYVTIDRVCFADHDPTGIYPSIEKAVAALGEAVADPYAKGKGKKGK